MKWTVYNTSGLDARIEARRSYPHGLNARFITLVATRERIDAACNKIGMPVRVRIGTDFPIRTEPLELQEGS